MYSCPNDKDHKKFRSMAKSRDRGVAFWDADGNLEEFHEEHGGSVEAVGPVFCSQCAAEAVKEVD